MLKLESADKMIQLHIAMTESFDEIQVRSICGLLKANYDKLHGTDKRDKIRELVLYANRRSRLDELIKDCRQIQPGFHWEDKALTTEIPKSAQRTNLKELGAILANNFSLDDLKQLAFYLGINFENVSGPHWLFGTTHHLGEHSKQWLNSQGIDYGSMSIQELDAILNKMWVEGFIAECAHNIDWKQAIAICWQLRPDAFS